MVQESMRHLFFRCIFAASINRILIICHEKDFIIDSNDGSAHGCHFV